ncbi:hypothetical protein RI367_005397 [Sorochytrium milnesiophthora]
MQLFATFDCPTLAIHGAKVVLSVDATATPTVGQLCESIVTDFCLDELAAAQTASNGASTATVKRKAKAKQRIEEQRGSVSVCMTVKDGYMLLDQYKVADCLQPGSQVCVQLTSDTAWMAFLRTASTLGKRKQSAEGEAQTEKQPSAPVEATRSNKRQRKDSAGAGKAAKHAKNDESSTSAAAAVHVEQEAQPPVNGHAAPQTEEAVDNFGYPAYVKLVSRSALFEQATISRAAAVAVPIPAVSPTTTAATLPKAMRNKNKPKGFYNESDLAQQGQHVVFEQVAKDTIAVEQPQPHDEEDEEPEERPVRPPSQHVPYKLTAVECTTTPATPRPPSRYRQAQLDKDMARAAAAASPASSSSSSSASSSSSSSSEAESESSSSEEEEEATTEQTPEPSRELSAASEEHAQHPLDPPELLPQADEQSTTATTKKRRRGNRTRGRRSGKRSVDETVAADPVPAANIPQPVPLTPANARNVASGTRISFKTWELSAECTPVLVQKDGVVLTQSGHTFHIRPDQPAPIDASSGFADEGDEHQQHSDWPGKRRHGLQKFMVVDGHDNDGEYHQVPPLQTLVLKLTEMQDPVLYQ